MNFDQKVADLIAEKNTEIARLTALLPPEPAPGQAWRVGTKCPMNLYAHADDLAERGEPVGVMRSPELAAHVVRAVNAWDWDAPVSEGRKVLDLPMDGDYPTVRDYLVALLTALWKDPGYFSGKYGLGNSDWPWDFYRALIAAKLITATYDDEGGLAACYEPEGDRLIAAAIAELGSPVQPPGTWTKDTDQ